MVIPADFAAFEPLEDKFAGAKDVVRAIVCHQIYLDLLCVSINIGSIHSIRQHCSRLLERQSFVKKQFKVVVMPLPPQRTDRSRAADRQETVITTD